MFRALFRQRRRVLFATFFFLLTIYLVLEPQIQAAWQGQDWLKGAGFTVFFFSLSGICIGTGLAILCVIFRAIRLNAEFMALAVFLYQFSLRFLPAGFASENPLIYLLVFFLVIFGLPQLLYGPVLDRFPIRLLSSRKRSFVSPKSTQDLWAELVPGAGEPSQYWEPNLAQMTPVEGQPQHFKARFACGGGMFTHRNFTILATTAPQHCRYRYADEVSARNQAQNAGTVDITLTPVKNGTRVTFEDRPDAQLPRVALYNWLDDSLGDEMDHLRARHQNRWDWTLTGRHQRQIARLS